MRKLSLLVGIALVLVAVSASQADTVFLKDGRKFENVEARWSKTGKTLKIVTRLGSITVKAKDVLKVTKEAKKEASPADDDNDDAEAQAQRKRKRQARARQRRKKQLDAYVEAERAQVEASNRMRSSLSGTPRTLAGLEALRKKANAVAQLEAQADAARKKAGLPKLSDLPGIRNLQKDAEETNRNRKDLAKALRTEVERVNQGRRGGDRVRVPRLPKFVPDLENTGRASLPATVVKANDAKTAEEISSLVTIKTDRFKQTTSAQTPAFAELAGKGRTLAYTLVALLDGQAPPTWFRLDVFVQARSWLFVEEAVEEGGKKVLMTKLDSGVQDGGMIFEQVGMIFLRTDLARLAQEGVSVRLYGKKDNLDLKIPAFRIAGFLLYLNKRFGEGWASQAVSDEQLKALLGGGK